jgi:FAD-linked sulfhydryl oxidase
MGTKLWGPDTWYVIHVIADSAPDVFNPRETRDYSDFYKGLSKVIPCPSCALHFQEFIRNDPPVFKTRMDALLWTVRAHNHANKNTNKPVLSEEEGLKAIQSEIEARNNGSVRGRRPTYIEYATDSSIPFTIGIVLGVIIAFLLHR